VYNGGYGDDSSILLGIGDEGAGHTGLIGGALATSHSTVRELPTDVWRHSSRRCIHPRPRLQRVQPI
jgi:hypothetical protein